MMPSSQNQVIVRVRKTNSKSLEGNVRLKVWTSIVTTSLVQEV